MSKVIYVSGGQKSGKTTFAQNLALNLSKNPIYLATSRVWDEDYKKRIERHKSDRGAEWTNIEEEKYISNHKFKDKVVLIDCVTLWMTNFFYDNNQDVDKCIEEAKTELNGLLKTDATYIIVSNEIGLGGTPANKMACKFIDMLGLINQYIAKISDETYIMFSGIPVKIK
ncbi:adenosylcobinamide kinase/adenosylcobinamide-phosphate guanylyltransferase [Methanococcus maripaludis]|uniref:Adenosylcobinamide kinase n=1 Tax=Methanococcus maripaludis TaxID=39152 RepID=A0A7J9NK36_METMI|nr:bifunctional adenosylcobinamide kinase/adenosylcobinamide-phosphate guanylyltransferase [Methanococcus maripaludis]MBA2840971.1 adenosylcobinamide kinase/adenosylcobinamide-phosphate guanylyltransferase [Methanococcus maripaludis]